MRSCLHTRPGDPPGRLGSSQQRPGYVVGPRSRTVPTIETTCDDTPSLLVGGDSRLAPKAPENSRKASLGPSKRRKFTLPAVGSRPEQAVMQVKRKTASVPDLPFSLTVEILLNGIC